MNAYFKGAACGVVASVSYGLNPLFALPLYSAGIGPDSVLFYRYVLAILMLGALTLARGRRLAISRAEVLPLMVLGVLFSLSSLTLYLSFLYMDAGIACTILFVYPLLVSLIMTLFFHEKATLFTYGCIAMALCGIAARAASRSTARALRWSWSRRCPMRSTWWPCGSGGACRASRSTG